MKQCRAWIMAWKGVLTCLSIVYLYDIEASAPFPPRLHCSIEIKVKSVIFVSCKSLVMKAKVKTLLFFLPLFLFSTFYEVMVDARCKSVDKTYLYWWYLHEKWGSLACGVGTFQPWKINKHTKLGYIAWMHCISQQCKNGRKIQRKGFKWVYGHKL